MKSYGAALYIHIPYCTVKCDYCDFYSSCDLSTEENLLLQIPRQIKTLKKDYAVHSFKTVYLGGGTPGLTDPLRLKKLLDDIKGINGGSLPREVTLECNPVNVSGESLLLWRDMGITRLSLGVQSFQDAFLKKAGRKSSRTLILKALKLIDQAACFDLNIDLIQGLPGMTWADQKRDLLEAVSRNPDHISWYSLILEKGTVLEDKWDERNGSLREDNDLVWEEGCRLLEKSGYRRYEISNFCKEGKKSIHNSSYWKLEPYMGCGPSAVSMLKGSDGCIRRFRNRADAAAYSQGVFEYEDCDTLSVSDFLKDYLLMGLRLSEGIDTGQLKNIFSSTPEALFPSSLEKWEKEGCLIRSSDAIRPTEKGMNLLNSILISIFEELDERGSPSSLEWPSY